MNPSYYSATFTGETQKYDRWNGMPNLLISGMDYVISVDENSKWAYLVTVYDQLGRSVTKIPYSVDPSPYWHINKQL